MYVLRNTPSPVVTGKSSPAPQAQGSKAPGKDQMAKKFPYLNITQVTHHTEDDIQDNVCNM